MSELREAWKRLSNKVVLVDREAMGLIEQMAAPEIVDDITAVSTTVQAGIDNSAQRIQQKIAELLDGNPAFKVDTARLRPLVAGLERDIRSIPGTTQADNGSVFQAVQAQLERLKNRVAAEREKLNKRLEDLENEIQATKEHVNDKVDDLEGHAESLIEGILPAIEVKISEVTDELEEAAQEALSELMDTSEIFDGAEEKLASELVDTITEKLVETLGLIATAQALSAALTPIAPQLESWAALAESVRDIIESMP